MGRPQLQFDRGVGSYFLRILLVGAQMHNAALK